MSDFATVDDVITLKRPLTNDEREKVKNLLPIVSAMLRDEAKKRGKDLDEMIQEGYPSIETAKSVCVDIVMREVNASTTDDAATQISQSAGGYSLTYSPLTPGGGLFIKRTELSRLGLRRQRITSVELL